MRILALALALIVGTVASVTPASAHMMRDCKTTCGN